MAVRPITRISGLLLALLTTTTFGTSAYAVDMTDLRISREGDLSKTCGEISQEVGSMEDLTVEAMDTQQQTEMANQGVNVVKSVGAYLVGTAGGAIGIMAAGLVVNHFITGDKIENAEEVQKFAEKRRSFMVGIYSAKGCEGPFRADPAELANIEPAAGDPGTDEALLYGPPDLRPKKPLYND